MFRYLNDAATTKTKQVYISINGRECQVPEHTSVWAAMAASGETVTRLAAVSEQPRSAYCAMGACFECLVTVDGQPNQQACMTRVRSGMRIERQQITESTQAVHTDYDCAYELAVPAAKEGGNDE